MDDDVDDIVWTSASHHRAARRIISDVLDVDTDTTANASRAKDRRLMDDITSRLLHTPEHSPYANVRRATSEARAFSSSHAGGGLNPSADQAIREAKRYLARLENELGVPEDDYNTYGRSNIVTKRERGLPVVYLGDDDMYIPVVKGNRTPGLYGYSSMPRLSRVTSHYDGSDVGSTSYSLYDRPSYAPPQRKTRRLDDNYELDDYFDETPIRKSYTLNGLPKSTYSSSASELREKPKYNFKLSDYANYKPPFRATMSDTRRNIRDLICKTRHDPHYYDD